MTGHVLCASCCTTIVEKTSPRLSPVCPFCREHFSSDDVRLIRIDFSSSGWSTPRRLPNFEANSNDFASEVLARKTERLLVHEGSSKTREARRLEDKVARVATQKCSVEEVSSLHKELHDWLSSEVPDDQVCFFFSPSITINYTHCRCLDLIPILERSSSASHSHEPRFPYRVQQSSQDHRGESERQG